MKTIAPFVLALLVLGACSKPIKDYAILSGKISNPNTSDSLTISNLDGYSKVIKVNKDGTFRDTLKVKVGVYRFFDGNEYGKVFLKNNNSTSFTLDTNAFDETLRFEGDAAAENDFMIKTTLLIEKHLHLEELIEKSENALNTRLEGLRLDYQDMKRQYPDLDSIYFKTQDTEFEADVNMYANFTKNEIELYTLLAKGTESPSFSNYENYNGSKSSLSDFKGKYVYIDVWATWCGPCKAEIPSLKKLESKYETKNIEFVSISVDDARRSGSMEQANNDWRTMVNDKQLTGTQLFSGNGWQADFIKDYKIQFIPRFILIDPDGNIINPKAPRPSSNELVELFDEIGI